MKRLVWLAVAVAVWAGAARCDGNATWCVEAVRKANAANHACQTRAGGTGGNATMLCACFGRWRADVAAFTARAAPPRCPAAMGGRISAQMDSMCNSFRGTIYDGCCDSPAPGRECVADHAAAWAAWRACEPTARACDCAAALRDAVWDVAHDPLCRANRTRYTDELQRACDVLPPPLAGCCDKNAGRACDAGVTDAGVTASNCMRKAGTNHNAACQCYGQFADELSALAGDAACNENAPPGAHQAVLDALAATCRSARDSYRCSDENIQFFVCNPF